MTDGSSDSFHIDQKSTLPVSIRAWEIYLRDQGKSDFTIKAFLGDIKLLQKFLSPDAALGAISTNDLNRFIEWLENGRGKGISCTPKSLARRVTTIKSFFRWLANHGRINFDPADAIVQHTVISPLPEVLTLEEEEKVLKTAKKMADLENGDCRPYVLLKLLLETGIKKSECLNIKKSHIFIDEGEKYLFVRYPDLKDRNKERKIPLSEEWVNAYLKYDSQYHFDDSAFPWSPRRLEYILEDIGKSAGLVKHLSFSMCRWNSALDDLYKGIALDAIRQKLGISKIQWREIKSKLQTLSKKE
jgi:site-specific recombinase XerD